MTQSQKVPKLRFPEFSNLLNRCTIADIASGKLSNGVFNDPSKKNGKFRLINVKDMYVDHDIDVSSLTKVDLSEEEFNRNKVKYGDVFFTRSSLVKEGIAFSNVFLLNDDNVTFDGHLVKLTLDTNINLPKFINYCLKTRKIRLQLVSKGKTATMTTIGQEDIASTEIFLPSLPEQTKIAEFLGAVDDRIGALKQKRELLAQYKRGIMQKIFTQKIRFTKPDGEPYPEWEEKKLGDVAEIVGGGTPETTKPEYWNGNINWFTPTELKTKYVNNSVRKITEIGLKSSSSKLLPPGTLLLSTRANVGDIAIAELPCSTNQGFQSLIVNIPNKVEFLYYWISMNKKEFISKASGSTFLEIGKTAVSKIEIKIPHPDEQQKIADFLSAIDAKIDAVAAQIEQTTAFKKGLLQQMFV